MSPLKKHIGVDVLVAAQQRISHVFDKFERIYVSFSAGKDSTVMLHLVMAEAKRRKRRVGVLLVDLEAQYELTITHALELFSIYADQIDPYWVCMPLSLRNAVSQFEPRWQCWDPERVDAWVRHPPDVAITDPVHFPFFHRGMEFEEFAPAFGQHYSKGHLTACFVGIRSDESLNRFRTLMIDKARFENLDWTTWIDGPLYNAYPIYDWKTEDIWTFHARTGLPYNRLYDRMHQAGLTIHQMRICQPYGDDQRKGLWLYHLIEPHNWPKVVARVNGANYGALYARESGNILGNRTVTKPAGHSWESYARFLLASMPPPLADHYKAKIATFLDWYAKRGYPSGIPDECAPKEEAGRKVPSWRRVAKTLIKGDYWCKSLSFSQTKSERYDAYLRVKKERKKKWAL